MRREAEVRWQQEQQRHLAAKALMSMLESQERVLTLILLNGWREEVVLGRKQRQQEEREAAFAVEVRRYKEMHHMALQGCVAKWGSERSSVLQGTAFCGSRDVVERDRHLRKHAENFFAMGVGDLQLVLLACWNGWKDARREAAIGRQREQQRKLAAKALIGMVADREGMLMQTLLASWKEEVFLGWKQRQQEEREAAFGAEVRRCKEMHHATLQGCMAKWGSESSSLLQGTSFCAWRDVVEKTEQLRKYTAKLSSLGFGGNPEFLFRACLEDWKELLRDRHVRKHVQKVSRMGESIIDHHLNSVLALAVLFSWRGAFSWLASRAARGLARRSIHKRR